MFPFSSSMLCGRGRRGGALQLCIVEPTGVKISTLGEPSHGIIQISIPDATMQGEKVVDSTGLSPSEWILLETLDCRDNRPLHTGPFLTVQRRRRRRKFVRTYLFKDPTLIDDLSVHQTNFVLDRINSWAFNAFILDNVTGGRPLPILCVHLFKDYGLLEHFNLDPVIVWKLFSIIEDGYHWRNPYHNGVHAADVTQAMHCFLQENMILSKLTPLEIFSAILAAVTHDLDHPGVNQPFLIATSNHLAALYKNSSVLENHHWRSAMGCLNESGVSSVLGPELVTEVERQIKSLVLATDITRQQEFLSRLKEYLDTDTLNMEDPEVRHFVLQIALKCADISNPCRPWDISRKWSLKVCEEFFRQGDYERQLNLPVTPLCDRYTSSVPKIQTGFYQFVVRPLFTEWHRMLVTPLSTYMMGNLDSNQEKWNQLLKDEQAHKEQIEAAAAKVAAQLEAEESAKVQSGDDRADASNAGSSRSVRFDPMTTITTASDSDTSDTDDEAKGRSGDRLSGGFLGIPGGHPGRDRRHSIATGLMGNIQVPMSALLSTSGISSQSGSTLSISELVASSRTIGRTVIRRESLPGTVGRTLPTKTILHLQRLSARSSQASDTSSCSSTAGATIGSSSPGDFGDTTPAPASPIRIISSADKSSCSSCSTTDEILDFTYSLPETGSRRGDSPRRMIHHDTTDLDELCPLTSIVSMSPSVAHVTLQQSSDLAEDQRRHLIRQHTCPVVSVTDGGGNFNRPRFLSAAAAVSPTTIASSSIINQHRSRNRSPETGSGDEAGRCSGGSSSEALICEVISEEVDRQSQSGGSSAEATPLEIFVQQLDDQVDNDGEAPRRESLESGSTDISSFTKDDTTGSIDISSGVDLHMEMRKCSVDTELSVDDSEDKYSDEDNEARKSSVETDLSALEYDDKFSEIDGPDAYEPDDSDNDEKGSGSDTEPSPSGSLRKEFLRQNCLNTPAASRHATILMWRNKRVWKSLTEADDEDNTVVDGDNFYFYGTQQGSLLKRLQARRGSAPTNSLMIPGRLDRRCDAPPPKTIPCSIHPTDDLISLLGTSANKASIKSLANRRGSAPVDILRQGIVGRNVVTVNNVNVSTNNKPPLGNRMGRRGSLPVDPSSTEATYAHKWMHVFPYNEDGGVPSKCKVSGGPDLIAAAVQKRQASTVASVGGGWNAQIFIETSASAANATPEGYWRHRRRGSLPVDLRMTTSGSCCSESESSGEASDT